MSTELEKYEQGIASMTEEEVDRLPESFAIEHINGGKLNDYLRKLGANFRQSGLIEKDKGRVYAVGVLPDGSEVRIEVKKGKDYQSPKALAMEIRERIQETKEEGDE